MRKHNNDTAGNGNSEVDLEARKAEMARIAEEPDSKEVEVLASAGKVVDDGEDTGSSANGTPAVDRTETLSQQISDGETPVSDKSNKKIATSSEDKKPRHEAPETGRLVLTDPAPNPFDPATLRLDQSFADTVGVKKLLTTVPVRKPNRQDFVRVHPDPLYRLTPAAIIELKEDREVYLVTPNMAQALPGEFSTVTLCLAINRQGVLFLWPVKLPNPDGKHNEWHRSAAEAAELAMKKWVRVTASMSLGAYQIVEAIGGLPEPVWPDFSFQEILRIAFRERIVDRPDHPLVRRLQGIV
jgi:hypothetical protein